MTNIPQITRIMLTSFYVLFLPGFCLSLLFFRLKKIGLIERIALSFALSTSVVPLLTFYANLLGVKINTVLVASIVLIICLVSLLLYKVILLIRKDKDEKTGTIL